MTEAAEFALLPLAALRAHEQVVPSKVRHLETELRRTQVFEDPIWVARGSDVILNGHHRVAALRRLGAVRVPAWVIDYESDLLRVDRWNPGPPIPKPEVVRRARAGELFPPQTTRHRLSFDLPHHPTPLADLMGGDRSTRPSAHSRSAGSAGRSRARSSPPG
ncbi:MAG: ParB N-terminal domain-containing protein [Thermoplasmata archaeon]